MLQRGSVEQRQVGPLRMLGAQTSVPFGSRDWSPSVT
jgi:hypothetical protein